ncbi:hypothetical protein EST38_g5244 [Candolleomyces aberdarensis]|uniref:Acid phosphatase n=1 Tax=Candolleomyces aberdarensis TaxID=2316362 RepID=A0A4V1Q425_9AGAR|nr:hypothetical protein EST38_g5244 [Candolleomyces aberdarensis]
MPFSSDKRLFQFLVISTLWYTLDWNPGVYAQVVPSSRENIDDNDTLTLNSPRLAYNTFIDPSSSSSSPVSQLDDDAGGMRFGFSVRGTGASEGGGGGGGDGFVYRYPQVPLDVENYPVAPGPLQLEQVHVFVRHGERTPVGVRLVDHPANVPEHWNMCKTAHRFNSAVSSLLSNRQPEFEDPLPARKIVERKDGKAVEGECLLGELTDLGRQSTYKFGQNLRRLYIDRLGFLPDKLENQDNVYFRTTNMPRTTESLQEIVNGLYPHNKCDPHSIPPIRIRNGKDENLIGNTYSCKRLEILQVGFAKAAADAYNPTLEHLDKRLSKYINGNPIRVDGRPRASGILDTIRSAVAHGIKVPADFEDQSVVDIIERAVVNEWFAGYKTEEVRRLGVGRLFEDMLKKIQHKIDHPENDTLKILVHSTHDTAIAAIRQTLDVFDDNFGAETDLFVLVPRWPAFTASVTFELFKAASPEGSHVGQSQAVLARLSGHGKSTSQHYVRMRYQNKSVDLPICAEEGKHLPGHPEFCTLEAFNARMKGLIPHDWDHECNATGHS